jgi:hypothetical protein
MDFYISPPDIHQTEIDPWLTTFHHRIATLSSICSLLSFYRNRIALATAEYTDDVGTELSAPESGAAGCPTFADSAARCDVSISTVSDVGSSPLRRFLVADV